MAHLWLANRAIFACTILRLIAPNSQTRNHCQSMHPYLHEYSILNRQFATLHPQNLRTRGQCVSKHAWWLSNFSLRSFHFSFFFFFFVMEVWEVKKLYTYINILNFLLISLVKNLVSKSLTTIPLHSSGKFGWKVESFDWGNFNFK